MSMDRTNHAALVKRAIEINTYLSQQDPETLQFQIAIAGHQDPNADSMRVMRMLGGSAENLARAMSEAVAEMITQDAVFGILFFANLKTKVNEAMEAKRAALTTPPKPDLTQYDKLGDKDMEDKVQELLKAFALPPSDTKH